MISGEWGDHVALQAATDKFAAKICLLTSFRDTGFIEIMPQYQAPKRGKTGTTPRLAGHHTASNFTKSILLLTHY
ncbi:hypothetical protein I3842_Q000500 [Carya illinoinensis]|uniref:Uncharacterized protein n=1 Tax=Carya illinoinensis TaxID=32201 RepID=A0A922A016_CARIL|nr:hypothetical protein I3842_Q000500 [Carya illinoinensis]